MKTNRILALAMAALAAAGAQAQYAPAGTKPAPAAKPGPVAPAPVRPAAAAPASPVVLAPMCFEPMDLRDSTLISVLHSNGLLCATSTKQGDQVRLRALAAGGLTAEDGPATAWHRSR